MHVVCVCVCPVLQVEGPEAHLQELAFLSTVWVLGINSGPGVDHFRSLNCVLALSSSLNASVVLSKSQVLCWVWWHMPLLPAPNARKAEAEAGGSL